MRHGSLLAAALLLTGCTVERWVKPGATLQEYELTRARCDAKAFQAFPPDMQRVQTASGYRQSERTECRGEGPNRRCTTTGGQWMPPSYEDRDVATPGRTQGARACMLENGWTPVQERV